MVVEMKLYHIPLFDADEFPRDTAAKGPEGIVHAIGEAVDYCPHRRGGV